PAGIVAVLVTPIIGRLKVDARWLATGAFLVFAVSFFMRAAYPPDASFWVLTIPLLLQGLAMSLFFVPLISISLDGLPAARVPSASGISNFARITAGAFAASVITTWWDRRAALHQTRLSEVGTTLSPIYRQTLEILQQLGFAPQSAVAAVQEQVV